MAASVADEEALNRHLSVSTVDKHVNTASYQEMFKSVMFLSVAVVFNVIVSLLFKQSSRDDRSSGLIILAVLLGVVNALCYTKSLAKIDLSVAYPMFAAASMILICIASCWIFRERVSIGQALGMTLIIGGMVLVCAK